MRLTYKPVGLSLVLLGIVFGCASSDRGPGQSSGTPAMGNSEATLAKCPVTGEEIDRAVSVDTESGPVYFCCKGCARKYQANPEKYAEEVATQRKALAGQR